MRTPAKTHAMPAMSSLPAVGPRTLCLTLVLGLMLTLGGCKDLTGTPGLPSGTPNPALYNSATGALGLRNAAVLQFESAFQQYLIDTGLLTDELEDTETGASAGVLLQNGGAFNDPLDERILPVGTSGGVASYTALQNVRGAASLALGALATYDTAAAAIDSATVLRGELYALEGYTELMLADLFCSGVPLSTLDYQKDFTYAPSATTTQVYEDALAKFDTALTLARTSDSVVNLVRVGQGRAYLELDEYPIAADDVATVPEGFLYQFSVDWGQLIENTVSGCSGESGCLGTVSDREGSNGLPYRSSGDPRTAALGVGVNPTTRDSLYFPAKYRAALTGAGYAPFILASGVEARLIQAEAALNGVATGQGSWIQQLNALRADSGMSSISDPGAGDPTAQVDTLFTERAAWLFLTGHRQGDLRRLLRQYGAQPQYPTFSTQEQVYPTGQYLAPGTGRYGTDVVAPIPTTEDANPDFHGCLSNGP
jgi:hypothetical protein